MLTSRDIAKMLDHSLLRPEMDTGTVRQGCEIALKYETATVCVKPSDLPIAREVLAGSPVKLSTVIGFPHGSNRTDVKVFESERAMDDGAVELDMVINIGRLIAGDTAFVEQDIRAVVEAAHRRGAIVKVILENAYLNDGQKRTACQIAERAGADFVKTSTGFAPGGATLDDVALMRSAVSANVQVKAAGGVRTLDAVLAYRAAGCTRCGATASAAIMDEAIRREQEGILHEIEG
ncbi:MAG: deoxyribose-phosphate aldolase [Eubacteriales bacterium]|nr:deoxyribose-phosphate aldolase [Clostridiales bacterium]MDD2440778.1 deoxyribose-phosphate aldolase [Eubacteriales bacterium]MDD4139491.1 deoxyribose-phosphate aldolase [Eubacteriales bacterium]MDD4743417.1 deoxyribose-phosphate aldolase [Eubacteriales bacterium]